jgi:hypothetical protein
MIKDYLRSVRKLKLDIEAKKRERDTLYMTLTGTTIRPKEVDVQTSIGGDVFGDRMAIVADYDRELEEEIINLIREQHKANQIINTLTVAEYRAVLTDYYINGYGEDRVLFGSDYPLWNPKVEKEFFMSLNLPNTTKEKIAYKNAEKLLGIKI